MYQRKIFALSLFLGFVACSRCPEYNSPTMIVNFEDGFNIKKVYGIGGGKTLKTPNKPMSDYNEVYELELAVLQDTTAYVFEHGTGVDTLVVSHTCASNYEEECGFYLSLQKLEIKSQVTTFKKDKVWITDENVYIKR